MKKILFILTIIFSTSVFSVETKDKLIVSYWSDGPFYKHYPIKRNKNLAKKINNVNVLAYAFMQVDKNGHVFFQYPSSDLSKLDLNSFCKSNPRFCPDVNATKFNGNFDAFSKLNNNQYDLKKIISVGGAGSEKTLENALNHPNEFIRSVKTLIDYFQLNGVDLDFEPSGLFSNAQSNQYVSLVKLLRVSLGNAAYISVELPGDNETLNSIGRKSLDLISNDAYISLMGYEFHSAFYSPLITGNNSNLYSDAAEPNINHFYHISDDQAVKHLTYLGVPPNKIILGFPAYFHAYGDVNRKNHGLYQSFNPAMTPVYERKGIGFDSALKNILSEDFNVHYILMNHHISAVYAYNAKRKIWISFDDARSIYAKCQYVMNNNLAGMMMWNIQEDYPASSRDSLLRAAIRCMM